jgi:hypothetical protein
VGDEQFYAELKEIETRSIAQSFAQAIIAAIPQLSTVAPFATWKNRP